MIDYTTKIKEICDALGSINVMVDKEEMVHISLGGLAQRYGPIKMAICTREKPPSFFDLQSILMVEENHVRTTRSASSDSQMLYMEAGSPHGCGRRDGSTNTNGDRNKQMLKARDDNNQGPSTRRGGHSGDKSRQSKSTDC